MPCGLAVYCQLLSVASAQMLTRDAGLGVVHLRVPSMRDIDRAVDTPMKFHNRRVLSGEAAPVGWVVLLGLSARRSLSLLEAQPKTRRWLTRRTSWSVLQWATTHCTELLNSWWVVARVGSCKFVSSVL